MDYIGLAVFRMVAFVTLPIIALWKVLVFSVGAVVSWVSVVIFGTMDEEFFDAWDEFRNEEE